jgi:hydroxylysine kinase
VLRTPPKIVAGGGLDTRAMHLPVSEAREISVSRYGLDGEFRRFATEKDDTFLIRSGDGRAHVLKIANPAEHALEIDFQIELLRHIAHVDPSLPVPRVVPDADGKLRSLHMASDGTARFVRVVSYLEGTPLDVVSSTALQRERIGEMLARLRRATSSFRHPGDDRDLAWDVQHLLQLAPLLSEVSDAEQRALLVAALERFAKACGQLGHLRRQVLHNDFSRSNILLSDPSSDHISGIIDFGDTVRTAIAIDVSTALLNQLPATRKEDAFAAGRDVLRGYLRFADLTAEEAFLVPHLTMGRVAARALLTIWRARIFPENADYILRNTKQGWWQLKWFLDRDPDQVSDSLRMEEHAGVRRNYGRTVS